MRTLWLLIPLAGCSDPMACPSLGDAEELTIRLAMLGYGAHQDEGPLGPGEVIQTQAGWTQATTRWSADGGLTPDFATDLVFVNRWDDACGEATVDYAAWRDGDRLRLVLDVQEPTATCDMVLPELHLLQVPHGGATDIAWCAPD